MFEKYPHYNMNRKDEDSKRLRSSKVKLCIALSVKFPMAQKNKINKLFLR